MSITLQDVSLQMGQQYKMKLIAGKNGCNTAIGWVHLVEESTIIQFLWSNDLVITLGVSFQSEEALMDCVKKLVKRHCVGLIVNTGKYILEIPQSIIDYCDENNFPLITIPWEINVNTVIKDITYRCIEAQEDDTRIAQLIIDSFKDPDSIEDHRNELMTHFDIDGEFSIALIQVENAHKKSDIQLQRISSRIRYYFENIDCKYLLFWYDSSLVLLANNIAQGELKKLCERMYKRACNKMPEYPLTIGVGNELKGIRNIAKCYQRARAALLASIIFKKPIVEFKDLGIYQLLLTNNDKEMMEKIYYDNLNPLIAYDEKHHTELLKTFEQYLRYNGSIQQISQELYTHRNTINYRVAKIKELLDSDLSDAEELFLYKLAFYIKKVKDAGFHWVTKLNDGLPR